MGYVNCCNRFLVLHSFLKSWNWVSFSSSCKSTLFSAAICNLLYRDQLFSFVLCRMIDVSVISYITPVLTPLPGKKHTNSNVARSGQTDIYFRHNQRTGSNISTTAGNRQQEQDSRLVKEKNSVYLIFFSLFFLMENF